MAIEIRRMTIDDIDEVTEIEKKCFSTPWSRESFIDEITKNLLAIYYVAINDGRVVGYAGMWHVVDELHITNVAVHPDYRGLRIGNALMEALIGFSSQGHFVGMTLEVRAGNAVALHLYEKYGFERLGLRRGYYQDNKEDAIIMWKELK